MKQRPFGRTRATLTLIAQMAWVPPWLFTTAHSPAARRIERRFHRRLLAGFGIAIEATGAIAPPGGTLYVSNHISWADIPILATLLDGTFVAKSEVGQWAVLGWLARRVDTLFVTRATRAALAEEAATLRDRLASGKGVILFPEGTTSDARDVLPFRSSLFAAADAARRIQPIVISYADDVGRPIDDEAKGVIAWVGEEALLPNAARIARRRWRARVHFLECVDPAAFPDRKTLAAHCEALIRERYMLESGQG